MNGSRNHTNSLPSCLAFVAAGCAFPAMTDVADAGPASAESGGLAGTGGSHGSSGPSTQSGATSLGGSTTVAGATSAGGLTGMGGLTNASGATGLGGNTSAGGAGATGLGGNTSTGGASATSVGGKTSTGGTSATNVGGKTLTGGAGATSVGGNTLTGGASATSVGGNTSTGGASATSVGGNPLTGGVTSVGGNPSVGGATSTGGASTTAGASATGGTLASGGTSATGGSGTCGARNCLSSIDNNCNGTADNTEPECACPTPNQTASCSTGLLGICAPGTKVCTFATDNSSSTWSACIGASPLTRNCSSTSDNNCDGTADNLESACSACGQTSPRACNTHPGYDGKGVCIAGSQTLNVASDNSQCSWSACTGDVGPTTLESCGPTVPDTNCDGVPGDGNSCGITTIHIYSSSTYKSCSCSGGANYTNYFAGTSSPGSGWTDVSSFKVFTGSQPAGTIAVVNETNNSQQYVNLATSYSASAVVGFISTSNPGGYAQLNVMTSLAEPCSGSLSVQIPFGPGGSGSPSSYYTVP